MSKVNFTRREFLKTSGLVGTGLFLQSCATYAHKNIDAGKELEILYYADTLNTLAPEYLHTYTRSLGPTNLIGSAPWIKGKNALNTFGTKLSDLEYALLGYGNLDHKVGGLVNLASVLASLRKQAGDEILVLENGQCWNGSGVASLTQGRSGAEFSEFLKPDVRVVSDEYYLWRNTSLRNYEYLAQQGISTLATTLNKEEVENNPSLEEYKILTKNGVTIGLVSANNPHNILGSQMLDEWFKTLQKTVSYVSSQVDLLIVLADVGNAPAFWLADRLKNADLILAARGMEYWPRVIKTRAVPIYFAPPQALGLSRLKFKSYANRWDIISDFVPSDNQILQDEKVLMQGERLVAQVRGAHISYLDFELAQAPLDIWQGDTLFAPMDILYKESLAKFYENTELFLIPGLRYKVSIPKGEKIRREDIFRLTGSYPATTFFRRTSGQNLAKILSEQANQLFGKLNLLDTGFDLPRLFGTDWTYRYAEKQPINLLANLPSNSELAGFSLAQGQGKEPLISQLLEDYLLSRPKDWKLNTNLELKITNAIGHPGWN